MLKLIHTRLTLVSLIALFALMLAACGAQPTAQPEPTPASVAPTETPPAPTAAPTAEPTAEPTAAPVAAEPLKVVATYSILGDLIQNVAGDSDLIELTVLVGPGGDAHTYQPTPQDSVALAEADILFENGLEFESWIDDLYAASGSTATRVAVAEGISNLIPSAGHNDDHGDALAHACEHFEDAAEMVTADAIDAAPTAMIPDDHTHYDVQLTAGAGSVALSRAEDAEVSFFLGSAVPFAVTQAGTVVEPERVEPLAEGCAAIAIVYTYDLAPGDYAVRFGPNAGNSVALVWEEAGHSHSHAEGEEHSHAEGEEHGHAEGEEHGHAEGEEHGHDDHGHSHGEYDPHVWHDPNNAMVMVEAIRNAFVGADPTNAAVYALNADAYLDELRTLDAYIIEAVAQVPEEQRKLVTAHDTFGYFARRYGFIVLGTALGSLSTEAADPSAGEIAELVEAIRAAGVPAIFAENVSNPALMETIAAEAGVQLAPTLYTDALGEPGSPGDTYLGMVRVNVDTIVTALGQ